MILSVRPCRPEDESEAREVDRLARADLRRTYRPTQAALARRGSLVEGAGGNRLTAICESLKPQAARYAHAYIGFIVPTFTASADEHKAVIDAIERGDGDGADRAIRKNLAKGTERYARVMETVGEKGIW